MTRLWKNVELEREDAEKLKVFLKRSKITYEPSECFNLIHFELYVNSFETQLVDEFLDRL